jgi:hypothetical protein
MRNNKGLKPLVKPDYSLNTSIRETQA